MRKKIVSRIMLALLLIGVLRSVFNIQPARTEPTTIVVPDHYPTIQQAINNANEGGTVYVKARTYYESIVINTDNLTLLGEDKETTVIDGRGSGDVIYIKADNVKVSQFTIRNSSEWSGGINSEPGTHISISNNIVRNTYYGIRLASSSNSIIHDNTVLNNTGYGVAFLNCSKCAVYGNIVSYDRYGIFFYHSDSNIISGNSLSNDEYGIALVGSNNTEVVHNNFVENVYGHVQLAEILNLTFTNVWDNGVEGNYWSDYQGNDVNQDGLGDRPYVINANNTDNYPLMGTFYDFNATSEYHVQAICNSTISDFQFDHEEGTIGFNVIGQEETAGFCRIMIPRGLMDPCGIVVDAKIVGSTELAVSNSTYAFLYFTFARGTHEVTIVPKSSFLFCDVLGKYRELLSRYELLNQICQGLLGNITNLQGKIDALNSTFQTEEESIISELYNIRCLMYIFISATLILIVTTVYFAIRKPRIKP